MGDRQEVIAFLSGRGRAAISVLCLGFLLLTAPGARAALAVITTTTDLQSLVEAVGGDRVSVVPLVPAGSDAEAYAPRPQDLDRLRGARLVVRGGLDHDFGLGRLLRRSGHPARPCHRGI